MKVHKLSASDIEYIKTLIERDVADLAKDISFFAQMKIRPKAYIDDMCVLTQKFEMDFWEVVRQNCSEMEVKRLNDMYRGKGKG